MGRTGAAGVGEAKGLLWSPWSRQLDRKGTDMPTQGDKRVHQLGEGIGESHLEVTHGAVSSCWQTEGGHLQQKAPP